MTATAQSHARSWGWPEGWFFTGLRVVVRLGIFLGLLFGCAGRLDWWPAWILLGSLMPISAAIYNYVEAKQPGLAKRRTRLGGNTKSWDKLVLAIYFSFYFAVVIVAALDGGRYGWAPMPLWSSAIGVAVIIACCLVFAWAMGVNKHFEATVRIQNDLDHQVVEEGPYRFVRHPGYVAAIPMTLGLAVALGSWWALIPAVLASGVMVVRTGLEDRTLQEELAGYSDYAQRVRYRLLPGVY